MNSTKDIADYDEHALEEQFREFCRTHGDITCSHCGERIVAGAYVVVLGDKVFCDSTCVCDYVGARDLGFYREGVPDGDEYRKLFPKINGT